MQRTLCSAIASNRRPAHSLADSPTVTTVGFVAWLVLIYRQPDKDLRLWEELTQLGIVTVLLTIVWAWQPKDRTLHNVIVALVPMVYGGFEWLKWKRKRRP